MVIFLPQLKYCKEFNMLGSMIASWLTLHLHSMQNFTVYTTNGVPLDGHIRYRQVVGCILYRITTHLDTAYGIHMVSKCVTHPSMHLATVVCFLLPTVYYESSSLPLLQ